MKRVSRFKTEAEWAAAIHYLLLAAGALALLVASVVGWAGAG